MGTEPLRSVLDPDFAIVGAKDIIQLTAPLLCEVVNHATHAHQRCQTFADQRGGVDEDVAPFLLHRIIMDMTDAMDVLVRQACGAGCIPLIRTSFEALLSLEYIFREDTVWRSLCWFCVYYIGRLKAYHLFDPDDPSGREFRDAHLREFGKPHEPSPNLKDAIANLRTLLAKPHLAPIVAEFERLRSGGRSPQWYALFGGPSNLRELARRLNREATYTILYRQWSDPTHAHEISSYLTSGKDGSPALRSMRYAGDLPNLAQFAAWFQIRATRMLLNHYRKGENLARWYLSEVRPKFDALGKTVFAANVIEE